MKFKETLGIDVSKHTLDVHLYVKNLHGKFDNTPQGHNRLLKWLGKQLDGSSDTLLICFEHTGIYSLPLAKFLTEHQLVFSMVSGLEIKKSLGIARGKSDKVDAKRIAEYAHMRRKKLKAFPMPSNKLIELQQLVYLREKLVKQQAGYKATIHEHKAILGPLQMENQTLLEVNEQMISYLGKQIAEVEKKIDELIQADQTMKKYYDLICSIKGVGPVIASHMLVLTNCFSCFEDSRKFACYAGIAPFNDESGTSKKKAKVSHYANKKIKALLNLAASTAIQHDPEIKAYYHKRIKAGKSKMSTLNIVRNKIVHRMFAVVKRGTPYVVLKQHAA